MIQKTFRLKWALKLGLGLLLFLVIVKFSGNLKDIGQLFLDINWYRAWPVVIWTLLINILASWRWHVLLKCFSKKSNFITLLRFIMIGRVVGHTTSQIMGDMGSRFIYLKSRDIELKQGALTILLDKILDGTFCIAVGIVFLWMIFAGGISALPLYPPALAVVLFITGIWLLPGVLLLLGKLRSNKDLLQELKTMMSGRTRLLLVALTLGKYSASAMRYMLIMKLSGIDLAFEKVFMGTAVAQIGLIAGITPGGLGLVEAGWAGALYHYGISSLAVARFLVAQRLLIFASVLLLSFLFIIHERLSRKRHFTQEKDDIAQNMPCCSKNTGTTPY